MFNINDEVIVVGPSRWSGLTGLIRSVRSDGLASVMFPDEITPQWLRQDRLQLRVANTKAKVPAKGWPVAPASRTDTARIAVTQAEVAEAHAQDGAAEAAKRAQEAREELAKVEAQEAEENRAAEALAAFLKGVEDDLDLAAATSSLLTRIRDAKIKNDFIVGRQVVRFAAMLQPLAKKHGYKIVAFGDGHMGALKEL